MKKETSATGTYSSVAKKIWKGSFILALALMVTMGALAQGGVEEDPDAAVPIDGGLSLLVAAGIGYGAKKVHEARKKKMEKSI